MPSVSVSGGMGTGNGGNTGIDVTSSTTGVWEFFQAPNGQSPFNEIIFYAVGGPAEVDVDALMVQDATEPGVWGQGDEIFFSVRAAHNFDGCEVIRYRRGSPSEILRHDGHEWDTSLSIQDALGTRTEEVDGIEVHESGLVVGLLNAGLVLIGLRGRRSRRLAR